MKSNAFIIGKNSILIYEGVVEIHHIKLIWTTEQYDNIETAVMNYLHSEGFLETVDLKHPEASGDLIKVSEIQIFDATGDLVTRKQLI